MIGTVLKARYQIVEKIGEGNLFTVYQCEDKIDNRTVVAKILHSQYATNRLFAERLLVEARAMIGVTHPGLVEVYDCGEDDGVYYVIVEHIRGLDLKERIRRNAPFTLSTAIDVSIAICDVLDFAHKRGFIHGDLRPGNIMVTTEGQLKIADFWVGGAIASNQSIRNNMLMHSVHYMSPETAEGKSPSPASDIYSLGVIIFELLTGKPPFDADSAIAIALKHARDAVPSMRASNPGVPKTIEALVVRAMQKNPEERFRSAKVMMSELQAAHDALSLSRPLVWSQVTDKKSADPSPEEGEVPESDQEGEPVVLSALRKVLIIFVIIAALVAGVGAALIFTSPSDVKLPNLVGRTLEEAHGMLRDGKIQISVREEQFNEEFPAGEIYNMFPSAGRTIKSGKSVDVWISRGSRYAVSPKVINLPLQEASRKVAEAGLNVGEISQDYSSSVTSGNVISQDPPAGTKMERGQSVSLVYSLGPKPEELPLESAESSESSETSSEQASTEDPQIRPFDISFMVPAGHADQVVEVRVVDNTGENVVLSETHQPGDKVMKTIDAVGDKVVIRIYIDDKLIKEVRK